MFNFKALHLGHYAKSFCLRDTPRALGANTAYRAKKDIKEYIEKKEKRRQVHLIFIIIFDSLLFSNNRQCSAVM